MTYAQLRDLSARAVPIYNGTRYKPLPGALHRTNIVDLEFLCNGKPLSGTPLWAEAPQLIAPGVVSCLRNLKGKSDAIVLSIQGFGTHRRRIGGRTLRLPSEAEIYLDYVVRGRIHNYEWIAYSDQDSVHSELLFEVPERWLDAIIQTHWEWHSINGYVVARRHLARVLRWVSEFQALDWRRRRVKELAVASVFFEDVADGTAVRFWSKVLDYKTLRSRMNLPCISRALQGARVKSRRTA